MLIGVIGKPNTGKSTLFKAATLAEAEIANYPFTTIKANEGAGFIRTTCAEKFFNVKCKPQQGDCIDGQRFVPVKLIDVAGLVPGAHKGKGLGNKFLNDLSTADVLIHVVDASGSTNEKGEPVEAGSYDPINDIKFLEEEIDLWFSSLLTKGWRKFITSITAEKKPFDKAVAEQFSGLKIDLSMVKKALKNLPTSPKEWKEEEIDKFASELRKASKPIIIAANKSDVSTTKKLRGAIPCSAEAELALKEAAKSGLIKYIPGDSDFEILKPEKLNDKQKKALEFIKNVLKKYNSTGIQKCLNKAAEKLITAYPVPNANLKDARGNILPDVYLLSEDSTAMDLAYAIHTDIGKKFIRAIDIKTKRTIGKEHKLKDGDVIEIIASK